MEIFCKFFSYFNVEQTLLEIKAFSHTVNLSHSCCFLSLLAIFASWCQNLKILPLRKKIYQNTSENDGIIGKYNPCILLPNIVTKYILIHGKNLTFIAYKEFKLWMYISDLIFKLFINDWEKNKTRKSMEPHLGL